MASWCGLHRVLPHLLIVKIPKGRSPEFKRTLVLEYRSAEPRIVFQGKD